MSCSALLHHKYAGCRTAALRVPSPSTPNPAASHAEFTTHCVRCACHAAASVTSPGLEAYVGKVLGDSACCLALPLNATLRLEVGMGRGALQLEGRTWHRDGRASSLSCAPHFMCGQVACQVACQVVYLCLVRAWLLQTLSPSLVTTS